LNEIPIVAFAKTPARVCLLYLSVPGDRL